MGFRPPTFSMNSGASAGPPATGFQFAAHRQHRVAEHLGIETPGAHPPEQAILGIGRDRDLR